MGGGSFRRLPKPKSEALAERGEAPGQSRLGPAGLRPPGAKALGQGVQARRRQKLVGCKWRYMLEVKRREGRRSWPWGRSEKRWKARDTLGTCWVSAGDLLGVCCVGALLGSHGPAALLCHIRRVCTDRYSGLQDFTKSATNYLLILCFWRAAGIYR